MYVLDQNSLPITFNIICYIIYIIKTYIGNLFDLDH